MKKIMLFLYQLGSSYGSMPLSQKKEVVVRWLAWVPFEKELSPVKDINLELMGGPGGNPADAFCLSKSMNTANGVSLRC